MENSVSNLVPTGHHVYPFPPRSFKTIVILLCLTLDDFTHKRRTSIGGKGRYCMSFYFSNKDFIMSGAVTTGEAAPAAQFVYEGSCMLH